MLFITIKVLIISKINTITILILMDKTNRQNYVFVVILQIQK